MQLQQGMLDGYDSWNETGFNGIQNLGGTCYLNSTLQYLFHLPIFRQVGSAVRVGFGCNQLPPSG